MNDTSEHSTIRQHNNANVRDVCVDPTCNAWKEIPVRSVILIREAFEATWVAVDLNYAQPTSVRVLEPGNHQVGGPCDRHWRPSSTLVVWYWVDLSHEESVPFGAGTTAALGDRYSFIAVPGEQVTM